MKYDSISKKKKKLENTECNEWELGEALALYAGGLINQSQENQAVW